MSQQQKRPVTNRKTHLRVTSGAVVLALLMIGAVARADCPAGEVPCGDACMQAGGICCGGSCSIQPSDVAAGATVCCGDTAVDPANPGRCYAAAIRPGDVCCGPSGQEATGCFAGQTCGADAGAAVCVCKDPKPLMLPDASVKFAKEWGEYVASLGVKFKVGLSATRADPSGPCETSKNVGGDVTLCFGLGLGHEECFAASGSIKGNCSAPLRCPQDSAVGVCDEALTCCKNSYAGTLKYSESWTKQLNLLGVPNIGIATSSTTAKLSWDVSGNVTVDTRSGACGCVDGTHDIAVTLNGGATGTVAAAFTLGGAEASMALDARLCVIGGGVLSTCGDVPVVKPLGGLNFTLTATFPAVKWKWFTVDVKEPLFRAGAGIACGG